MSKSELLAGLYRKYREEFKDKEIVTGDGSIDSKLLMVGEAPGRDEVKLSKPFVGQAGKNLNEFIDLMGVDRQSIYITNAIKYRLSKVNPQTGKIVNRPASKEDIRRGREYLLNEVKIIGPEFIVTLGNVPLKAVTGEYDINIGAVHGKLKEVIISGAGYFLYPLYHPASLIYNRSLKDTYIADVMRLKIIWDR